jgi:alkyldihydroxyacetonephosphate synthase
VAETSTTWANIDDLYQGITRQLADALGANEHRYWVGCHLSHSYHAGAAIYFTFAFRCKGGAIGEVDQMGEFRHYLNVKRVVLDAFQAHDATLSHHHSVGYEHLPWLEGEASLAGAGTLIDAVKPALDPGDIMNPGKLRSGFTITEWEDRAFNKGQRNF